MQNYDLIIAGGGTSGCACAYTASKLGFKTLLLEKNSYLGGAITSQLVIPAMKTAHGELNQNFFNDFIDKMHNKNAQITYCDGNPGWFNPFIAKEVLYSMLIEAGCEVLLNTNITQISTSHADLLAENTQKDYETEYSDNKTSPQQLSARILSICFDTKYNDNTSAEKNEKIEKFHDVKAKYFVDATGNADLSKLSGVKFLPDEGAIQAMSLRFVLGGVDKKAFANWLLELDTNRDVTTVCEVEDDIHLSTACTWDAGRAWALAPLFDSAVADNVLQNEDRAYFQLFSIAGMPDGIAFNCPRLFSNKVKDAYKEGLERILRLSTFAKKYLVGFENSYVYKVADCLGIRESGRVKGKYILTSDDIISGKEFEHPVAISDYPIDVHSLKRDNSTLKYVQKPYQVPLESLMSADFDNLFVIGRCISADFLAQAAIRIQPTCFSMGEGLAKHLHNKVK